MNDIIYKIKTASISEIESHLIKCSRSFIPALETVINIDDYSLKLFKNAQTFEAWNKNEIIGLIAVYVNNFETLSAYISNVSVFIEYSGSGIAKELLNHCVVFCKNNGFVEIKLEVNKKNLRAIKFYEKNNFVKDEEKIDTIIMKILI